MSPALRSEYATVVGHALYTWNFIAMWSVFAFVASSLLLFKQTKIATHKGKFSLSEATDYDELRELQEQLMLADPSTGKVPNNIRKQLFQTLHF